MKKLVSSLSLLSLVLLALGVAACNGAGGAKIDVSAQNTTGGITDMSNASYADVTSASESSQVSDTALQSESELDKTPDLVAAAEKPEQKDAFKTVKEYLRPEPTSVMDRERIVYARELFMKLKGIDQMSADGKEILKELQKAEALIWAFDIEEIYTVFKEVGPGKNGSFGPGGGLWAWDSWGKPYFSYNGDGANGANGGPAAFTAEQKKLPQVVAAREYYNEISGYEWGTYSGIISEEYDDAKEAEAVIDEMDSASAQDVANAREAYNALSEGAKARVLNYEKLKKAEGINDEIPSNIVSAGGRAWRQGDGLTPEQYGAIARRMKEYFPNARSEFVWITGMLESAHGGITINVDFDSIADGGKYTPDESKYPALSELEWRAKHIKFTPQPGNAATHEDFLTYFDTNDIYVYLQVESGFADMETLIDIYYDVFNVANHKCVLGFAVDVEWYYGIDSDQGIPVSDGRAKQWAEYLYRNWGEGKAGLLLKHYNCTHLPLTYRGGEEGKSEKLIFCNDSQNAGSWDGSVAAEWDSNTMQAGAAAGFGREFKRFADFYPDNKVVFQIGYDGDRQWIYAMDDPIIKSLSVKLAEATAENVNQEISIAWVNFTYNDPLTFGDITAPEEISKVWEIRHMLGYLEQDQLVGRRFDGDRSLENGGTGLTSTDAKLIKRLRELVDSLPDGEEGPNGLSESDLPRWREAIERLKEIENALE
ncbi:MAG: hypothetical protein LBS21_02835 [Clostridiales bacterium]|jgi:predicted small secreted protein|nr:hypothetical protein [Clostridiales bacterium]